MNTFWKGLLIAIVTLLLSYFTNSSPCLSLPCLEVLGIITAGNVVGYIAQHYIWPSTSLLGKYNQLDAFKTLLMAVSTALSNWGASWVTGQPVDLKALAIMIGGIILTHIVTTLKSTLGVPVSK